MTQSLREKIVVVTGASSGIGRAVARLFATEGARLALVARSTEKLKALAREIGGDTLVLTTDLALPAEVDRMIAAVLQRFGRVDVLMPNAGIFVPGPAVEGDPDAWDHMLSVNVNSVFRAVRAVLPSMIAQRSGDILVTSSIAGHEVMRNEPVYSASKHAVQTSCMRSADRLRRITYVSGRSRRAPCRTSCGAFTIRRRSTGRLPITRASVRRT